VSTELGATLYAVVVGGPYGGYLVKSIDGGANWGTSGSDMDLGSSTCLCPLDLVDDDPKIFVSRRSASSDK